MNGWCRHTQDIEENLKLSVFATKPSFFQSRSITITVSTRIQRHKEDIHSTLLQNKIQATKVDNLQSRQRNRVQHGSYATMTQLHTHVVCRITLRTVETGKPMQLWRLEKWKVSCRPWSKEKHKDAHFEKLNDV